jgi:hypothetical protein
VDCRAEGSKVKMSFATAPVPSVSAPKIKKRALSVLPPGAFEWDSAFGSSGYPMLYDVTTEGSTVLVTKGMFLCPSPLLFRFGF